jgi:hypothetical protein
VISSASTINSRAKSCPQLHQQTAWAHSGRARWHAPSRRHQPYSSAATAVCRMSRGCMCMLFCRLPLCAQFCADHSMLCKRHICVDCWSTSTESVWKCVSSDGCWPPNPKLSHSPEMCITIAGCGGLLPAILRLSTTLLVHHFPGCPSYLASLVCGTALHMAIWGQSMVHWYLLLG